MEGIDALEERISEDLSLIERMIFRENDYYSRYRLKNIVEDDPFRVAIEKLGGYVYNVCVGKIGDVIIFNGFTWVSVHGTQSYEDGDEWARKLVEAL